MITDNSFDILCLTETWLKPNDYIGLNESTPPSYCYKHEPRRIGHGGGVSAISSQVKSALLSILPHVQYIHTEN